MQPVQPPLQPFEQPLKHAVPQPEHLTEQFVLQPDSDPPISSIALATMGLLAMIAAPIIGRVRFAAFLKNSRLDWSSSFFLFFCILFIELKDAYELPNSALIFCFRSGNKKDVGVCSSAPISILRPSHCLHVKISNASLPTPSDII